jgi:hypothetical protein
MDKIIQETFAQIKLMDYEITTGKRRKNKDGKLLMHWVY